MQAGVWCQRCSIVKYVFMGLVDKYFTLFKWVKMRSFTSGPTVSSCPLRARTLCPDTAGGLRGTGRASWVSAPRHSPPQSGTRHTSRRFPFSCASVTRKRKSNICFTTPEDQHTENHTRTLHIFKQSNNCRTNKQNIVLTILFHANSPLASAPRRSDALNVTNAL